MARTMTDEQERELRENAEQHLCLGTDDTKAILAELDAERAAHEETINRCGLAELATTQRDIELAALKARLALAEAVCDLAQREDWTPSGAMDNALAAWRAGK